MKYLRGAARSPLFLRVFVLMLICVAVVQSMNVALLIAVQTPTQKVYTVGQIADAVHRGADATGEVRAAPSGPVVPAPCRDAAAARTGRDPLPGLPESPPRPA